MAQKGVQEKTQITQQMLSEATGVPQSTISKLINDRVERVERQTIVALCRYFDCEIGDLLFIDWSEETK
jgi:putative transcriptional regulator